MAAWTHDQHRSRRLWPQGGQPHMGRPAQYLLLDRPDDADRRRDHDADPSLRRSPGPEGLSTVRTRDLSRDTAGLKIVPHGAVDRRPLLVVAIAQQAG